jgi:uncharacterized protein YndB with AHSA1/START domain
LCALPREDQPRHQPPLYARAIRVEESIEIARSPETVWAVVVDPLNDPRWCAKVKSVEVAGDNRWTAVHKPVPLRPAMELVVEQLDVEAPSRLRLSGGG